MRLLFFVVTVMLLFNACTQNSDREFIIHNIFGYTLLEDGSVVEFGAIAVQNGRVLDVGISEEILGRYPNFDIIDGERKTLLPGLIDAHAHVMGLGIRELDLDISGIRSKEETIDAIRDFAEENPDREWITGRGWNQVLWEENEFPTARDIDQAVPGRPVYLTRVDGHAAWVNSRAMEIAGINADTPDPQGGVIHRDNSGNATGIFIDAAMRYISSSIPERTKEEFELALKLALAEMAMHGITSVHDASTDSYEWNLYKKFADEGRLITRIYAMIAGTGDNFDGMAQDGPIGSYADDLLALRSVKISADGALGSRGAALLENYSDDPGNRGLLFYSHEELNNMLLKGASAGFQMNIHAIGDAANRQVLDAFDYIYNELENQESLRHRIEHAQIVNLNDISRFKDLEIIASMQPTHATSDMNMAEDRVGSDRIKGAYAWQTFINQGTVIAGGSDFPVENVNPFYGLYSAVTRKDHKGLPPEGWYSEQRLSRIEALRAFTYDAAYSAHQEDILGSLEPGKWADFVIIDRDFFSVDASEIWQIEVLQTWVAGEKVYEKE